MPRLTPWQEKAVSLIKSRQVSYIAFETGLGKTIAALTAAEDLGYSEILVIAPELVHYNWKRQLERFGFDLKIRFASYSLSQTKRYRNIKPFKGSIASFVSSSRQEYDLLSDELGDYDFIVFDEADYLRNFITMDGEPSKRGSLRVAYAIREIRNGARVVNLSATPISKSASQIGYYLAELLAALVNDLQLKLDYETVSAFKYALREFYRNSRRISNEFVRLAVERLQKHYNVSVYEALQLLRLMVSSAKEISAYYDVWRITKRGYVRVAFPTPEVYDLLAGIIYFVTRKEAIDMLAFPEAYPRELRPVLPKYFYVSLNVSNGNGYHETLQALQHVSIKHLLDRLDDLEGSPVVFVQYVDTASDDLEELKQAGFGIITGNTSLRDREKILKAFYEKRLRGLVLSSALAVGIDAVTKDWDHFAFFTTVSKTAWDFLQNIGRVLRLGDPRDKVPVFLPYPEEHVYLKNLRDFLIHRVGSVNRANAFLLRNSIIDALSKDVHIRPFDWRAFDPVWLIRLTRSYECDGGYCYEGYMLLDIQMLASLRSRLLNPKLHADYDYSRAVAVLRKIRPGEKTILAEYIFGSKTYRPEDLGERLYGKIFVKDDVAFYELPVLRRIVNKTEFGSRKSFAEIAYPGKVALRK